MSFKTAAESVEKFFEKFFSNTSWETKLSADLGLLAPGLEAIVALTAKEENAAEIQKVVTIVQTDLGTVAGLVSQIGTSAGATAPAKITTILNAIKATLPELLAAGFIKDAGTVTEVTAITNGIVGEVEAFLALVPAA